MLKDETIARVLRFRDDRDWLQFHTPKDLAISLSLEAAELLEVFQWSGTDLQCEEKRDKIREELADVLSYCILMADVCGMDLDEIMNEKVTKNEAKYPVEKARGRAEKYTEL
ncbi:nucleotide pyrophosphohydrolase [uncultured Oscillibacter sp.]|uniref:nucleotide pyrophosphohydrolase n=1 Tax=uncultured Oscillibacter sp. TaxID=876091 RepID=UPI00280B3FFA|nr:nucleotide pyrophosphohydrolase [uncultured Oscillibacter sp.]